MKNYFGVTIGEDLKTRFSFADVSTIIPKAFYGIL